MAVSQPTIKAALLSLYNDMKTTEYTETQFADAMATIIKDAILSATVNVTSVSGVTTGTGTSGPGSGTLS